MRIFLPILLVLAVSSLAQALIVKGPYLQDVRTDRVTVVCETDCEERCSVSWGPGLINQTDLVADGIHHEGVISGLSPSSCYGYHLTCGDDQRPWAIFCTAALPSEPFSFVVYGDTRTDHTTHRLVVDRIREEGVDFYINTGDLVSTGNSEGDWVDFFDVEGELMQEICLYPVVGNHDDYIGDIEIYSRLFAPPSDSSGTERHYSFRYSNAAFIALDNQSTLLSLQKDWLMDQIDAARADPKIDHIFVMLHETMYSSKSGRGGDAVLRGWRDDLKDKGVNAVFSGHDHYYERGQADNGLLYVIAGGGGAPLYSTQYPTEGKPLDVIWQLECVLPCPHTIYYSKALHHYLRIEIAGPYFHACAKDTSGVCFDEFGYGEIPDDGGIPDGTADGGEDADGNDGADDAGPTDAGRDAGPDEDPCKNCLDLPYEPLCGEDGETYFNLCEADCRQVGMDYWGECVDPDAGVPDAGDPGGTDEEPFDCANCPEEEQPVCGKDGRTYRNECVLYCMRVELSRAGPCEITIGNDCNCGTRSSGFSILLLVVLALLLSRRSENPI